MDPADALSTAAGAAGKLCPKDTRDLIDFMTLWTHYGLISFLSVNL